MVLDATVSCTYAASHISITSSTVGGAAEKAERLKMKKYESLQARYIVTPVVYETSGIPGPMTKDCLSELGKRLASSTGNSQEATLLWQRLCIAVQRGNAISIHLGMMDDEGEGQAVVE